MKFIDTKRFSPVAQGVDIPRKEDLFHFPASDLLGLNQKNLIQYHLDNKIIIDDKWWKKQLYRCLNGYTVENAISEGGDYIVDGEDCFWTKDDCYIPQYDLLIKDRAVTISGRYYFYLNFAKIRGMEEGKGHKTLINPRFLAMDFFFARRSEMMREQKKDLQDVKSRQVGHSKKMAGMELCYNYLFMSMSQNIIVAGEQTDADSTFDDCLKILDELANTQFHLRRKRGFDNKKHIRSLNGSEIFTENANDDPESLNRYSPSLVVYEEIGKGKEGWSLKVEGNVKPSIYSMGEKTGYSIYLGCVCKGTRVYDKDGKVVNIEDLDKLNGILGYSSEGVSVENIIHYNPPQKKRCFKVTTKYGGEILCSEDHPFLITHQTSKYAKRKYINGKRVPLKTYPKLYWEETKNLKVGHLLGKPGSIPFFGEKEMWNPRLVGMLIGDGSYGINKTPVFSNSDKELLDYVKLSNDTAVERTHITKDNRTYEDVRIKGIISELRELGIYGQTKRNKRLPKDIHLFTRESICELIAGLYDTDGYLDVGSFGEHEIPFIKITQVTKELLVELKSLLLRLGIDASLSTEKARNRERSYNGHVISDRNQYHVLRISNRKGIVLFAENIKLLCKRKQDVLDLILKRKEGKEYTAPVEVVYNKHSKETIIIPHENISFDRVVKVEDIGMQDVYNLTTDKTHTYLANDFITHNTGGDMVGGVKDLMKRAYAPHEHNILAFKNKWVKEGYSGDVDVCHFIPKTLFTDVDDDGNPFIEQSKKTILAERDKLSSSGKYLHVSTHAIYLDDVFQSNTAGYFGAERVRLLNERYNYILTHKTEQITRKGHLEWVKPGDMSMGVVFVDATEEELQAGTWWCEILEEPETVAGEVEGGVYKNLYISGTDTYNQDESENSDSQGAFVTYKKWRNNSDSPFFNTWVCLILERPSVATGGMDLFFEHTLMSSIYYNAENNHEYVNPLFFRYYEDQNATRYLMERPTLAFAGQIKEMRSSNRYGTDKSLKPQILAYLRQKLDAEQIGRMYFLRQIYALARFKYNPGNKYNCDITIATAESMIGYKEIEEIAVINERAELKSDQPIWVEREGMLIREVV